MITKANVDKAIKRILIDKDNVIRENLTAPEEEHHVILISIQC